MQAIREKRNMATFQTDYLSGYDSLKLLEMTKACWLPSFTATAEEF
jgi:hypothetical protein